MTREATLRAEIAPDTRLLRTLRAIVRAYCRDHGYSDDVLVRGLLVAVTEVGTNAMEVLETTGSRDPLQVECTLDDHGPRITIEDRGGGFTAEALESVSAGEKVKNGSGLGLGLQVARGLVSDMSIDATATGTRISLTMAREIAA